MYFGKKVISTRAVRHYLVLLSLLKTSVLVLNVRRTVDLCITERRLTLCIDVEGDYFIHRLLCQCHWTMMIHSDVISF